MFAGIESSQFSIVKFQSVKLSSLAEKAENGDGCHFFNNSNSFCLALNHLQLSSQCDAETQTEAVPPAALHWLEIHAVLWLYFNASARVKTLPGFCYKCQGSKGVTFGKFSLFSA